MDPYVVDLPWPLRRLLVSLILIKRPAESAHAYSSIWWDEGSPLIVLSGRPAGSDEAALAAWTGGTGDALRPAGHREGPARPGAPRYPAGDPGAAVSAVRRQHHDHRRTGGAPGDRRPSPGPGGQHAAAVLRPAGLPRCPGGKRASVPAAAPRPSVAELPWLARAAHPQAGEGSCPRPAGREQPQRQPRSPRPLLPQPVPAHRRGLRRARRPGAGALVGVVPVALGRASGSSPIPTPSSTNWCSAG